MERMEINMSNEMNGYSGYNEKTGIEDIIKKYRPDIEKLNKYASWLESKCGKQVCTDFEPDDANLSLKVPVYDSTLMSFIKTANETQFMNRNYVYTYSKYHIRTIEDELAFIDRAGIAELLMLGDILSKYVLKGMQKADLWPIAVREGIFFKVIDKMKKIIEYWTMPL